jgi:hypothetical protein
VIVAESPALSRGERAMLVHHAVLAIVANTTMSLDDVLNGLLLAGQEGRLRALYDRDTAGLVFDYDELLVRVPRYILRQGYADDN